MVLDLEQQQFSLHHLKADSKTKEVFILVGKPNRFRYSHSQTQSQQTTICSVKPTLGREHWHLTSTEPRAKPKLAPTSFLDVLQSWGNTWLWKHLTVMGGVSWLSKSITNSTLVAVIEGSYIRELFPNLCSAAIFLE
jgi:hypothetical protein